ncbi:cysteine desulfurase IscS [Chitinophaga costaii]|uniref:cysteine desulfurase n=1 Tax=Chitinophaga costaii TaxID=1335309 RepID=A0A1C4DQS1_9BACT|nr:IscS subfamily cysteine desulfurase [Chitinophaga costaii]PUZ27743.1 IscS subfamily cysteine desulfurase [Chitinophaga costaii]SCC33693.1 cysteine desulfurase IscS [Chitinophaga costaii]
MQSPIYLDYNATTPCDPQVLDTMLPYFTQQFGNAASTHPLGWSAGAAVEKARGQVAQLIGATAQEIIFTSGATEADNLGIKGVFEAYAAKGHHIITVATEHKAVLDTCHHLEKLGAQVTYLPVDSLGHISLEALENAITPQTILISVMYANNETGVIHPIRAIGAIAKKYGILFMTDATQAVGKIPVNVVEDGIDLLACSAHKIYGPKGVGALYVRRKDPRVTLTAQMDGGGHERGFRSGTMNVPGIVGFGKAAELCRLHLSEEYTRLSSLRNTLENGLLALGQVTVNGDTSHRLPQVSNLAFGHVSGEMLSAAFTSKVAISSGSACTAASMEPSFVLLAMGIPDELARASLRLSVGRFTTEAEITTVVETISTAVSKLRQQVFSL